MNQEQPHHAWNPGLASALPNDLVWKETLFLPEHNAASVEKIETYAAVTGWQVQRFAALRPARLALHETLIRLNAELYIPEGDADYELGRNFRTMLDRIYTHHILPRLPEIERSHAVLQDEVFRLVSPLIQEMTQTTPATPPARSQGLLSRFRRRATPPLQAPVVFRDEQWLYGKIAEFTSQSSSDHDREILRVFHGVCFAMEGHSHGVTSFKGPMLELARDITALVVGNDLGSRRIGEQITPWISEGIDMEGYRRVPLQETPFAILNKGPSAAGKTSLRPRHIANVIKHGGRWEDVAVISPDIWRKSLLDYDTLGENRVYAGELTSSELEIIDAKLDRHLAEETRQGRYRHMLLDRYKFDGQDPEGKTVPEGMGFLPPHANIHLYFVSTSPEETVERAWQRGEAVGRYKSVRDTLLFHRTADRNISEYIARYAQSGHKLLWLILNNDVPLGEIPSRVAYGHNDFVTFYSLPDFMNVGAWRNMNLDATTPDAVRLPFPAVAQEQFLQQFIRPFRTVHLADPETKIRYATIENGELTLHDPARYDAERATPAGEYIEMLEKLRLNDRAIARSR